jgi:hypothetical protein
LRIQSSFADIDVPGFTNTPNNVFSTWTPESAYLLGLFYADGCLNKGGLCTYRTKDKQLINLVRQLLNYGNIRTESYPTKKGPKSIYSIAFGQHMSKDLQLLGMPISPKANKLTWPPNLPPHLTRDFIRGFFDGDGSASINTCIMFNSSSLEFLLTIEHITHNLGCYPHEPTFQETRYGSCYMLSYGNVVDVALLTMYMYLYPTTTTCLLRKRLRLFKSLGVTQIPDTPNLHYPDTHYHSKQNP